MPLTRRSRIKEAWRHPVGHDLLQNFLRQTGKTERWLDNPFVANASLQALDRMVEPGFCDMLLEMAAHGPENPSVQAPQRPAWWKEAVVYHIYLPSFMDSDHDGVGDLGGVAQRLPYLQSLGVDVLWLWPVVPQDARGNASAYDRLGEDAGGEDFAHLLDAAHQRGMRVVLGLDIAATSDEHPWFVDAPNREEYYVMRPGSPDAPPNNWSRDGRSVWSWYPEEGAWGLHLGGRHKMDLNWDNAALRKEMAALLAGWAGAGVDGFFFGPVHLLSKSSYEDGSAAAGGVMGVLGYEKYAFGPRLHRYLRELRAALPPNLVLAGEVRGAGTEMAKLFTADERGELDMILDGGHLVPRGKTALLGDGRLDLADLKRYYLRWMEHYGTDNWMALFLEDSAGPRMVSRLGASPLYRAILAKLLGTMLLTLRGTPILYQGQELGIPNTRFAGVDELRDAASRQLYDELCEGQDRLSAFQRVAACAADNARTPMPWSSGAGAGFTGAVPWMRLPDGVDYLNAAAQMEDPNSVWRFYQRLLALRKASPCLVYGSFNPVFAKNNKVFCYFRILEGEKWYVEMNLTERQVSRPGRILRTQKLELSNYDMPAKALRAYEANLYRCE